MKNKPKHQHQTDRAKSELVPEKDHSDMGPTGRYINDNPYKTPPNNLTTKSK